MSTPEEVRAKLVQALCTTRLMGILVNVGGSHLEFTPGKPIKFRPWCISTNILGMMCIGQISPEVFHYRHLAALRLGITRSEAGLLEDGYEERADSPDETNDPWWQLGFSLASYSSATGSYARRLAYTDKMHTKADYPTHHHL